MASTVTTVVNCIIACILSNHGPSEVWAVGHALGNRKRQKMDNMLSFIIRTGYHI